MSSKEISRRDFLRYSEAIVISSLFFSLFPKEHTSPNPSKEQKNLGEEAKWEIRWRLFLGSLGRGFEKEKEVFAIIKKSAEILTDRDHLRSQEMWKCLAEKDSQIKSDLLSFCCLINPFNSKDENKKKLSSAGSKMIERLFKPLLSHNLLTTSRGYNSPLEKRNIHNIKVELDFSWDNNIYEWLLNYKKDGKTPTISDILLFAGHTILSTIDVFQEEAKKKEEDIPKAFTVLFIFDPQWKFRESRFGKLSIVFVNPESKEELKRIRINPLFGEDDRLYEKGYTVIIFPSFREKKRGESQQIIFECTNRSRNLHCVLAESDKYYLPDDDCCLYYLFCFL